MASAGARTGARARWVTPRGRPDREDRPVLAAAIRLGCDVLVTGDRTHFGAGYGRMFGGVTIHSPRTLAERILPDHGNAAILVSAPRDGQQIGRASCRERVSNCV